MPLKQARCGGVVTIHEQHRQRVRARFQKEGLDGFAEHEVLELLLFYAIPRADTNETAHLLLETFGSLERVLDASPEDLMRVKGVGTNAAGLLAMIPPLARRYCQSSDTKIKLTGRDALHEYARSKYIGVKNEIVYLLCLDQKNNLNNCCRLADGSLSSARVDSRYILELVLRNKTACVVLMHNHPNGIAAPSREDVASTKQLLSLLDAVHVRLADHLIVADGEIFSMAVTKKFESLFL